MNDAERLESLREWYGRRSREFESANYQKYKENKEATVARVKKYNEFESRIESESEKFRHQFAQKFNNAMENCAKRKNAKSQFAIVRNPEKHYNIKESTIEMLRPEDLLVFEEEEQEQQDDSSSTCPTIEDENTSDKGIEIRRNEEEKINFEADNLPLIDSPEPEETVNTINTIKVQSSKHTIMSEWLNYYVSLYKELQSEVEAFERDPNKKELRVNLARTLASRINDIAKRNSEMSEIAALSNFLEDLFQGQEVTSWKSGVNFKLDIKDRVAQLFAFFIICDRFFEQIKWDVELIEGARLVLIMLCKRQAQFHRIFCAKVLNALTLLNFDFNKVLAKVASFGNESSQEAAAHWISNEQAIFRLFCKVELALKPPIGATTDGIVPQQLCGINLLRILFTETMEAAKEQPVPLCTPFLLGEMLNNFWKQLSSSNKQQQDGHNLGSKLFKEYIPAIKESAIYKLDEQIPPECWKCLDDHSRFMLSSRQNFLVGSLEDALKHVQRADVARQ